MAITSVRVDGKGDSAAPSVGRLCPLGAQATSTPARTTSATNRSTHDPLETAARDRRPQGRSGQKNAAIRTAKLQALTACGMGDNRVAGESGGVPRAFGRARYPVA